MDKLNDIKPYNIEKLFDLDSDESNYQKAITKRREYYKNKNINLEKIPFENYNEYPSCDPEDNASFLNVIIDDDPSSNNER